MSKAVWVTLTKTTLSAKFVVLSSGRTLTVRLVDNTLLPGQR
jgi:hypothetical protein